jgi:hypothetical protein
VSKGRRSYGPEVGEPPVFVDPRRWGALVGVAGGLLFVFGNASVMSDVVAAFARVLSVALAVVVLVGLVHRPTSLGPFREPRRAALVVYMACVVGEFVAIAIGTRVLIANDREILRPALIATIVGLHFVPFAWAFGERMFTVLGLSLMTIGGAGLIAGLVDVRRAPGVAAVLSGLVMLVLLAAYALGRFVPSVTDPAA